MIIIICIIGKTNHYLFMVQYMRTMRLSSFLRQLLYLSIVIRQMSTVGTTGNRRHEFDRFMPIHKISEFDVSLEYVYNMCEIK